MVLISGLQCLEDEQALFAYGIQDGKTSPNYYCQVPNRYDRCYHQSHHETTRRKEEEEEEGLYQAQEDKAQAQKEIQGSPRILRCRQHRKDH